jgi:VWFA-related protein
MTLSYRAGLVLSIASLLSSAAAQVQVEPASTTKPANHGIVLDVVVTDASGKAVSGLEEKDFTVLDNGHEQKILTFHASGAESSSQPSQAAEPPVKIILLVDEVNSDFRRVAYERDQIKAFLLKNDAVLKHPMSMAFFSDKGTEVQKGSSSNGNDLLATFDQHETALRTIRRSAGFYGAVDRFQLSMTALNSLAQAETNQPGRKLVVWISPGWPMLSGPGINLTPKDEANIFASIVSTTTSLREARITLYSVDPEGAGAAAGSQDFYYRSFLKPVTAAKKAQFGNLALQVIATQSGGLATTASNDITSQIARCVNDADAYYTLVVDQAPADAPNSYHALTVNVAKPGLTSRTRDGYYVQP